MNGINGHNIRILGGLSRDMAKVAQAKVQGAFVLCMNDPALVADMKAMGAKTIYRQSGDDPNQNPLPDSNNSAVIKQAAIAFTDERGKKNADYVHLTNELGTTPKLHEFTRYCYERCHENGWKGVGYNYYTHANLQHFTDALDNIRYAVQTGQAVGVHMYPDYAHDATVANFLNIRRQVGGVWIATEFNYTRDYTDAHRGWRNLPETIWRTLGYTSLEDMRRKFIAKWSRWLHDNQIGSTWFSLDYWDQPDLDKAKEFGYGYFDLIDVISEMGIQNQIYKFTGGITPMPDYTTHNWGNRVDNAFVSCTDNINVRSTPAEDASGNPTGVKVGSLVNAMFVSYWDAPFQNTRYQWYKILFEGVERYVAQVADLKFTPVAPPAEEMVEIKKSDLDFAIEQLKSAEAVIQNVIAATEKLPSAYRGIQEARTRLEGQSVSDATFPA